jgi:nucleoside-diphosphate-sugar epimerase
VSDIQAQRSCIVLGSRGFIGSAVVRVAEKYGFKVTPVEYDNYESCIGKSANILINANGNSKKYLATNDPATDFDLSVRSVSRSLADFKVDRYVYLSSMEVYADRDDPTKNAETVPVDPTQISPYGLHKHLAEMLVQQRASKHLIIRMGGFVGRGLKKNSIYDILTGGRLFVHPDSSYQYIETDALANIVFRLLSDDHQGIFNLTGDGTISLHEIADLVPSFNFAGTPAIDTVEHCSLNIDKIKEIYKIPTTRDTVSDFINQVMNGKIRLP